MSDTPNPGVGITDAETADQSIQRAWDRYAMADLTGEPSPAPPPLELTTRSSSTSNSAMSLYESTPAFDSTTALGDAFAKAESGNFIEEASLLPHGKRSDQ
ncbi:MAG: hypothetical protein WAN30_07560 [Acidimicrobiales bacterium]